MAVITPNQSCCDKIEPIVYLLFAGMVFFAGVLIGVEIFFHNDSAIFQVVAGLLTGFSGAFFGRLKPSAQHSAAGDDNSTTTITNPTPVVTPLPDTFKS